MVGCDGNYRIDNFREACEAGWKVATAAEYFANGGTTVVPNNERWVDVTWDSNGNETSLQNWTGHFDSSNSGGWDGISRNSDCTWISMDQVCTLSFVNIDYGTSYGCHCRGGDPNSVYHGVVCVKGMAGNPVTHFFLNRLYSMKLE